MISFTIQFKLSREYLAECFDESLPHSPKAKPNHSFALVLFVLGAGLLIFTDQPKLLGIVLLALVALELIHNRYRRTWWLARQMWGRTANSEVTLTVNDEGMETSSSNTHTQFAWSDVDKLIETDLGLIFVTHNNAQQYLSKSLFTTQVIDEIKQVIENQTENP